MICDEAIHLVSLQVGVDETRIADFAPWPQTTSEHQKRIRDPRVQVRGAGSLKEILAAIGAVP